MVIESTSEFMGPDPLPVDDIAGVPEETRYLADRLDQIIELLAHPPAAATKPRLGNYFCMPPKRNDFPQPVRLRTEWLIFSVSAAAIVTVRIGAAVFADYEFAVPSTVIIPFAEFIDRGTDVNITASAGGLRVAYLVGTPDEAEPSSVQRR